MAKKDEREELWDPLQMAAFLGISDRTLRSLVERKIITPTLVPEGGHRVRRFEPIKTNVAYRDYCVKTALDRQKRNHGGTDDVEQLKRQKLAAEALLKEAQLVNQQYVNDLNSGRLIRVELVERNYRRFLTDLRKYLFAIPSRVVGILSGLVAPEDAKRASSTIDREVRSIMEAFTEEAVVQDDES